MAEQSLVELTPSATATDELATVGDSDKKELLARALHQLNQGKRFLLVKDIGQAVVALGESCELLVAANGPLCADNAEAHYFYGKALLEQARAELAVFDDGGVPGDKGDETAEDESEEEEEGGDGDEGAHEGSTCTNADDDKNNSVNETEDGKKEEDLSSPSPTTIVNAENIEEASSNNVVSASVPASSSGNNSKGLVQDNEQPSTSAGVNGTAEKEEEELSNLELAWEVLEIAKIGFTTQEKFVQELLEKDNPNEDMKKSKSHLRRRLAETHSLLGEVATESENYHQAVDEFLTGIKILSEIDRDDSREIAQYYFQIGLAYAFGKNFQLAIDSFKQSKSIIELRIRNLQELIDNKQTVKDLGLPLEDGKEYEDIEIQELKAILPELDEKVADTIDAEKESKSTVEEEAKEKEIALKNSPVKNPTPPVANDISHLVKKKKKAEEDSLEAEAPPLKRPCNNGGLNNSNTEEASSTTSTNGHEKGEEMMKT